MSGLTFDRVSVKNILKDITFTAKAGEVTALIGKNGSGKTTALRAVSGELKYKGRITVSGKDIDGIPARERARLVSLMPQMLPSPQITVRELVALGRFPHSGAYGALNGKDLETVDNAIKTADIEHIRDLRADTLSGGERKSAFLALLLAQDTPVVMLDEPTAHLDAEKRRALYSVMRALSREGRTVLCVMHDINDALDIGDKLILLDKGGLAFSGTPTSFHSSGLAESIFGLEKCTLTNNGGNYVYYI